jgi:hypothetical protein
MRAAQHGYSFMERNQQRGPAQGLFEQRLSLNQRAKLLWEMTPKDPVSEGAESHSVTCGKNDRGAIEA